MSKLKTLINDAKKNSLSDQELLQLVDGKANLIKYSQLKNFDHIEDILKDGACVILYESRLNYGHWTCLIKRGENRIEHFDSYGLMPDDELLIINKEARRELGQVVPFLSKLLYESGYTVEYNDFPLQQEKENINTCGRWVAMRIRFKNKNIDDFSKMFELEGVNPDDIVTLLSLEFLK